MQRLWHTRVLHTETFTSCTETFTQNRLCTQTRLLYADAFIHTSLCTQTPLQKEILHRETLHIDAFTQGTCTQWFYKGKPSIFFLNLYTQKFLRTEAFTQRNLYTQELLHTVFKHTVFKHTFFFTEQPLYRAASTHRNI